METLRARLRGYFHLHQPGCRPASMAMFLLILFLFTSNTALSQTVKSLPGFPGELPFKLETGYVGVGYLESVQLFYYFAESESNPDNDPLLLWLTGGPGCSGFSGLVFEVGPLQFDYVNSSGRLPTLKLNPYSWTKAANMIFIDAPVGTGFSYATNSEAYQMNDTLSAAQTYEFLQKWLLRHPQFLKNPLYIAGDSYSGIVLPIIVQKISDGIETGQKPMMNLQGYVLGNPVTDQYVDKNWRVPYAHRFALISDKLYESTKRGCKGEYVKVDPSNGECLGNLEIASECTKNVFMGQVLEPNCASDAPKPKTLLPTFSRWDPTVLTHDPLHLLLSTDFQRPSRWCRSYNYIFSYIWANDRNVQNALHIREGTKKEWTRCNESLSYTYNVICSVPYHQNLIKKGYAVLIYSGDHDMVVPFVGTFSWIKSLNLTVSRGWQPWFYADGQVGGYTVRYTDKKYSLVYATVKGGGHTAPEYRPKECLAMISTWLAGSPL